MTVTRCVAACNELGYAWAGLQNRERKYRLHRLGPSLIWQNVGARSRILVKTRLLSLRTTFAPFHAMATPISDVEAGVMSTSTMFRSALHPVPPTTRSTTVSRPCLDIRVCLFLQCNSGAYLAGCFNGSQPLPSHNWWSGAMTVEQCTQGCKEIGQPLAAINSGTVRLLTSAR